MIVTGAAFAIQSTAHCNCDIFKMSMGRPHLFITTTTNPKWPEISDNLLPHQTATDRPDIVVRVLHLKLKKLMDILKKGAFEEVLAWLYAVVSKAWFATCSDTDMALPNAKIAPDQIDLIIRAEIPSPIAEPLLHDAVNAHMIHGSRGPFNRGSPCMRDGNCTKKFPKELKEETQQGRDGYPQYRRHSQENGGHTTSIRKVVDGHQTNIMVDNRWVVPYSPWLLRQTSCHTDVETCMSIKSIKYVLKYEHKGTDRLQPSTRHKSR